MALCVIYYGVTHIKTKSDISPRGAGLFGKDMVETFEQLNKVQLIARTYQLILEGYKMMFNDKLVKIWSAPNYCY